MSTITESLLGQSIDVFYTHCSIEDIDGLAKETFSDWGLAGICASVCNPTLKMSPFLDDADMTADALEQGDRLVASHPSSFSVQ